MSITSLKKMKLLFVDLFHRNNLTSFKTILILFLLIGTCTNGFSQLNKKAEKLFKQAEMDFLSGNTEMAVTLLNQAIEKDDKCGECWKLKAQIFKRQNNNDAAKESLVRFMELQPSMSNKIKRELANLEMMEYNYEKAIAYLEDIVNSGDLKESKVAKINEQIDLCKYRITMKNKPVDFNPVSLSDAINSTSDEYLPTFTADGNRIFFTRKFGAGQMAQEDFYWSQKNELGEWTPAQPMGLPVNTEDGLEGALTISPDGQKLFFARKKLRSKGGFDLFYTYQVGEEWILPMSIGQPLNTPTWESQPCISADGTELYFASKRPGGKGDIDIWVSRLVDNTWQEPENVPGINTAGKEQCPFLHPDGQTMYFSSNGLRGMGEADLFRVVRQADGSWGEPQNLGYPINTSSDENSLVVDREGKNAYYSRFVENRGFDLFSFELPKDLQPQFVTYVSGTVFDKEDKTPLASSIEIIDLESGIVINTIQSDEKNGNFLLTLPVGKDYAFSVEKESYVLFSDNFSLQDVESKEPYKLDIGLEKIKKEASFVLENIFFETGKSDLKSSSYSELDKLVELLNDNANIRMEIIGHTDNVGDAQSNLDLSVNRAKAVSTYLSSKGIVSSRLSHSGKGETQPIADNETEEGRAQNRRTEFKVLQ